LRFVAIKNRILIVGPDARLILNDPRYGFTSLGSPLHMVLDSVADDIIHHGLIVFVG